MPVQTQLRDILHGALRLAWHPAVAFFLRTTRLADDAQRLLFVTLQPEPFFQRHPLLLLHGPRRRPEHPAFPFFTQAFFGMILIVSCFYLFHKIFFPA